MKYLKEIKHFIGTHVHYDQYGGGYIWGNHKTGVQMIAQTEDVDDPIEENPPIVSVRGWGAIKHLFKTTKEMQDFQDELGEFIAEAINDKLKQL